MPNPDEKALDVEPHGRIWTCDGCGLRSTWRKGWRHWPGVESRNAANKLDASLVWPAVACSSECEDKVLRSYL